MLTICVVERRGEKEWYNVSTFKGKRYESNRKMIAEVCAYNEEVWWSHGYMSVVIVKHIFPHSLH